VARILANNAFSPAGLAAPQGVFGAGRLTSEGRGALAHLSLTKSDDWSSTGHELHVAGTFALSFGKLDPTDAVDTLAIALLFRAACFAANEPIPRWLLRRTIADDDDADDIAVEEVLVRLVALGLIEEERDGSLVLHLLVGAFAIHRDADAIGATREAVEASVNNAAYEQNEARLPGPLLVWQPHLPVRMIADYAGAKAAYTRALAIFEKSLGADHPCTAIVRKNLGLLRRCFPLLPRRVSASALGTSKSPLSDWPSGLNFGCGGRI